MQGGHLEPERGVPAGERRSDDGTVPRSPERQRPADGGPRPPTESHGPSRTGAIWAAVTSALLLLVLLVVFILQNQATVEIKFLGWSGTTPVGIALLVAAVVAGALVAVAGTARVIQLRHRVKRAGSP